MGLPAMDGNMQHLVPRVLAAAATLPTLGPLNQWPTCLRGARVLSDWIM